MEVAETGRDEVGYRNWTWPPRLAHRMLGDGNGVFGRHARCASRRRRSDLSPPRERDRAIRSRNGKNLLSLLDARALSAGRRPEDVKKSRQLLHASRPDA